MDTLLAQLRTNYPDIDFVEGQEFCWSPSSRQIKYKPGQDITSSSWALLHELGHALLGHNTYQSDLELLLMEVAAWDEANRIARTYKIEIDQNHIQDCLDTYRDWLDQRSTCPVCGVNGLQTSPRHYNCYNCSSTWEVSLSRFCRPYRQINRGKQKHRPGVKSQAMFK